MTRYKVAGSLVLLAAISAAFAGGGEPKYKTPQEAWQAARKGFQNKDWKAIYNVLTAESREKLTGQVAFGAVLFTGFAKLAPKEKREESMAKVKPLVEALARHGLTEAVLKKMEEESKGKGVDAAAMTKVLKKLIAPIKDRRAFVVDTMAAMDKFSGGKMGKGGPGDAELTDVVVKGDKATAVGVSKKGDKEEREPIEFRRQGGGWRLVLPEPKITKGKGAAEDPPRIK